MIQKLAESTWLDPDEVVAVIADVGALGRRTDTCTVVLKSGARIPFVDTAELVGRRIRDGQQS